MKAPRLLVLAAALASAALQALPHLAVDDAEDRLAAVCLAWGAAIWLALEKRAQARGNASTSSVILGAACVLAAWGWTIAGLEVRGVSRLLPFATGAALAVMASGIRALPGYRRELVALLVVPLVCPLPFGAELSRMLLPHTVTAVAALMTAAAHPVAIEGSSLVMPAAILDVLPACAGVGLIGQLLGLTVVVLFLFDSSTRQKLLLVAASIVVGFAVNAGRVAFLGLAASRSPDDLAYWDRYGEGSLVFPLTAVPLVALAWWLVLWRRAPAATPSSSCADGSC